MSLSIVRALLNALCFEIVLTYGLHMNLARGVLPSGSNLRIIGFCMKCAYTKEHKSSHVLCSAQVSLWPFVGHIFVSNNKVEASFSMERSSMLDNEMTKLFCFN